MTDDGSDGRQDAPAGVDTTRPSPARIYDVYLGGKDNFAVDREAALIAMRAGPDIPRAARENRAFLGRAVRLALDAGVRQFLDIGTGLPTQGNVHEVAAGRVPPARVVYVDNDPIVLAHGRALVPCTESTAIIRGDLREPATIFDDPRIDRLIDFAQPVAVLLLAVLHFATDHQVAALLDRVRAISAPGSYLVISHSTTQGHPDTGTEAARAWQNTASKITSRDRDQVARLFSGFELLEPGVVWVPRWRPDPADPADGTRWMYAGMGEKTG